MLRFMVVSFRSLLPTFPLQMILLVLLLFLVVFRRKSVWAGEGGARRLRPWVFALSGILFLVHHSFYDADPDVARVAWPTLAVVFGACVLSQIERNRANGRFRGLLRALAVASVAGSVLILLASAAAAPTLPVALGLTLWALWLLVAAFLCATRVPLQDALLFSLVVLPVCTYAIPATLVSMVPALREEGAETVEEGGYAYSFCERPEQGQLFLTMPVGATGDLASLAAGYVVELSGPDHSTRTRHDFFGPTFYGGLRQLLCLGDVVQVTMNRSFRERRETVSNVFEFRGEDPQHFRSTVFDAATRTERGWDLLGHVAAHDITGNSVYYVSEWSRTIDRLDLRTGEVELDAVDFADAPRVAPAVASGLITRAGAIHATRGSLYVSEWLDGSLIYEIDLESRRVLRTFDTFDSGSFGLMVDEERDRLLATNLWGLNVIDLESGELVSRRRLGPGPRSPLPDARRGLVFVPTTFGGDVWVLARDDLRVLGRVASGVGGRAAYITLDGRSFLASDDFGVYRWRLDALTERFRAPD
jgi:hypothetical protein